MKRRFNTLVLLTLVALLSGCAGIHQFVKPGTSRDEIINRLGQPTGTCALPTGERLQYSLQPAGHQIYNLDLDAQGRLQRTEQVLDDPYFSRIGVDSWTTSDVLCLFGKPARIEHVARFDGEVWIYRYNHLHWDWVLGIHVDRGGVVRQVSRTEERPRGGWH
jgi:hypothetical protein